MSKPSLVLIGHTFLGILILLTLIPFNLTPSLAAPATQVLGRRRNLHDENGLEILAGERPHTQAETLALVRRSLDQQTKLAAGSVNPITAQGATFVVHYNPTGDCKTTGLLNFIPNIAPDPWPDEAKVAFEHALSIWSMVLDANQTIVINACWADRGNANTLGTGQPVSAFADFTGAITTTTNYPVALANELAGADLNDAAPDDDGDGSPIDAEITMSFNSNGGINWYFGTDSNPGPGQKDFVTAALHEVAHGLGFVSSMFVDTTLCGTPDYGCWGTGTGLNNMPLIYDRFLENNGGQSLVNTTLFPNPSLALGAELTGTVRFNGPNAVAADNNSRPRLYTPNTFDLGSSILHLNQGTYQNTPNRLMTPTAGDPQHHPGPITLGILKDIGWNIIDRPLATFTKSASATSVAGGQVLTYTLTVTNTGYLLMTDVTITDTVPVSTTLDTASLSGGVSYSGTSPGSLMTWTTNVSLSTINTLSRTFAVTVNLEPGVSAITNTAYVTSSAGVGADDTTSTTVVIIDSNSVFLPIILSN